MKFIILITLSLSWFSFTPSSIFSQEQWERIGPITFSGIQKLSTGTVIASSDAGSLYTSSDEGITWAHRLIMPNRAFLCLRFSDNKHGLIGANGGYIESTTDGGKSWIEHYIGTSSNIVSLAYPAIDTAFICTASGECFRSINQGSSWSKMNMVHYHDTAIVKHVVFPTSSYGIVAGENEVYLITTNGGETWKASSGPIGSEITALDATTDGKIAYGMSDGHITTTLDGFNWFALPSPQADTLQFPIDVIKIHNDTVFAFMGQHKHWLTTTFSNKWWAKDILPQSEVRNPTIYIDPSTQFNDIYFDDSLGIGMAVGSWGTMYRLTNFGKNGKLTHHCSLGAYDSIAPHDGSWAYLEGLENNSNSIHAIGNFGPFSSSSDGGATWFSRIERNYGMADYLGLHFTNDSTGLIFCSTGIFQIRNGFLNTSNNGATWDVKAQPPLGIFYSCLISETGKLYLTGDSTIYVSSDEGFNWKTLSKYHDSAGLGQTVTYPGIVTASFFKNDSLIFLETQETVDSSKITQYPLTNIVASNDGGHSWEKRFTFPNGYFGSDLRFISPTVGYGTFSTAKDGYAGQLWRTSDGGFHWNIVPEVHWPSSFIPSVFSRNGKNGIVAVRNGADIFITNDSGVTWKHDSVIYFNGSSKVGFVIPFFVDDSTTMISSKVGFWKKSFGVTKSAVEPWAATSNPYLFIGVNPSPAVGPVIHCKVFGLFSIHDIHRLSLKLFNLLGKEIMDVSQAAQAGYDGLLSSFELHSANLSPGIYTFVLTTDNGGTTRNIIVVK